MSNKKFIYIEVELFQREFQSRFLLACEAASRGYEVYIATRPVIFENSIKFNVITES